MLSHQEIVIRLCIAAVLGGIVGLERGRVTLPQIESELEAGGFSVNEITLKRGEAPDNDSIQLTFLRSAPRPLLVAMATRLQALEGVRSVTV